MTVRQYCEIHNNQVIVNLPLQFKNSKKVLVIVDDESETANDKFYLLKKAATDPLFLADVAEVENDFAHTDTENL